MPNTKGTQKIILLLATFAAVGLSVQGALEDDGKITGLEATGIIFQTGLRVPAIIKNAPEAFEEAKDLTVPEVVDVVRQVQNLPDFQGLNTQKVAAYIELGIRQLQIFQDFKDIAKGQVTTPLLAGNVSFALEHLKNN